MSTPPRADRHRADPGFSPIPPVAGDSTANDPSASSAVAGPSDNLSATTSQAAGRPTEPEMDPRLTTIQPGGGVVMSIELAWGACRRWILRKSRPGYVDRMRRCRRGQRGSLPFEPVDPRDLKYYRNQHTFSWTEADDPFTWRDRLPFVRVGLAELVLLAGAALLLAALAGWWWRPLAVPPLVVAGLIVWFFRDPQREIPTGSGLVVSPADGKLVQIERVDDPELGPSVQFGIFLSIFNVHVNRASLAGEVLAVRYRPGKFLNALRPESARENENLDVVLAAPETPGGRLRIRQITGQFARRIVCWVRPGDRLARGERYGMIKLGSRTELVVPDDGSLHLVAEEGDKVYAGSTILARTATTEGAAADE